MKGIELGSGLVISGAYVLLSYVRPPHFLPSKPYIVATRVKMMLNVVKTSFYISTALLAVELISVVGTCVSSLGLGFLLRSVGTMPILALLSFIAIGS